MVISYFKWNRKIERNKFLIEKHIFYTFFKGHSSHTADTPFKKTFTKETPSNVLKSPRLIQGIIYVKSSLNNTIITLTDLLGNTKAWVSCGSIGFKGAKRSSRFAGQAAAEPGPQPYPR
jgi:hypothetical protein